MIYEDDFGDSSSGWDDAFDAYTTKQYGNNRYQIEVTTSNLVAWGLANRDVADFEVEVEAKLEDGEPIVMGMACSFAFRTARIFIALTFLAMVTICSVNSSRMNGSP